MTMRSLAPAYRFAVAIVGVVLLLLLVRQSGRSQQPPTPTIRNFSAFPDYYPEPNASQPKSQVQGAEGLRVAPDKVRVTTARLTTFKVDGSPEVLIEAPECIYDQVNRTAGSAGPLQMRTADGKFQIEGEGFVWQQTNSSVFISNDVRTLVQADLLALSPGASNAPGNAEPLHIFSRQFDYSAETSLGNYRDDVRVVGTNLGLSSRLLTVQVPMKERQLQTITAEGDVAMEYSAVHATGQRAVWQADTGLATITGQPRWFTELRQGQADELVIDATNKVLHANDHASLKMQGQTFGTFGDRATNRPAAPESVTNHFVEILADHYDLSTNVARFNRNVRAQETAGDQVRSTMTCGDLTAWYSGTNQLQQLVAERDVVIDQEEQQLSAGQAVYTATNGLIELTEQPRWRSGQRSGKGDRMFISVPDNEMSVYGNAYMKLPAGEAGQTVGVSLTSGAAGATQDTNLFAELFSNEYVVRPQVALFEGQVRLEHPQIQMSCDHLAVHSGTEQEKQQSLIAEHSVVFDLFSTDGQKVHGTCQQALYNYGITATQTNDVLRLTGDPKLETTNGMAENSVLVLDRARNKLIAPSVAQVRATYPEAGTKRYHLRLAASAIPTNQFPVLRK